MVRLLHQEPEFADLFIEYLLSRNVRIEEDLVDQLFNSSEKRLARILLLLAHFGKEPRPETVIAKVSQAMSWPTIACHEKARFAAACSSPPIHRLVASG